MNKDPDFGLFSSQKNRFLLVGKNYDVLKQVQFLTMNHELLYMVNLSGISNYRTNLLTINNCIAVGISTGEKMRIEVDMYVTNPSYRLDANINAVTNEEKQLQNNLILVSDVILLLHAIKHRFISKELSQVEFLERGLKSFKKFVSLVMPDDQQIKSIIDKEIKNKYRVLEIFDSFDTEVFDILLKIDYSKPTAEIKQTLLEKVRSLPMKCYFFRESINMFSKEMM
jgi:hypothetical protein